MNACYQRMAQVHSEKLEDSIPLVYDLFLYVPVFPESQIQSFLEIMTRRIFPHYLLCPH